MKIVLENLTKRFPGRGKKDKTVTAVDKFNFEFKSGKLTGLLGPSGCGKSTVLNMISGLLSPTEGKIYFGEEDVTLLSPELRGVGMVFQSYALYPHLTVLGNIIFPLQNLKGKAKMSKEEMIAEAEKAAKLVQIEGLLMRKPAELSGGQMQRVAIARALVKKPKVLLLDEPLSNLDARLRLQTREEIRRIQKETGITTVFVTHDQEEAMSICDEIVVMKDGVINQMGAPQEVYDNPENIFVSKFLGTPPVNVFSGEVKGGKLYIGDEAVMDAPFKDALVTVGIRPEGFAIDVDGAFSLKLHSIEVMGRDKSFVMSHEKAENEAVRVIVPSESVSQQDGEKVSFSLKKEKVFVFDKETGERMKVRHED
ncbi:MAG: ABC transporter ATP-binding protein [Clostridia bacterium]|nr:ABC transporter ATP-binding protein [Clostridia bacterium]